MRKSRANKPTATTKTTIRCAIYTRKSREEGLDQEFNSLDAQREAGQVAIPTRDALSVCHPQRCCPDGGAVLGVQGLVRPWGSESLRSNRRRGETRILRRGGRPESAAVRPERFRRRRIGS